MAKRVSVYSLRIMGPDDATDAENQEAHDDAASVLHLAEDVINDHLTDGYYCKIEDA